MSELPAFAKKTALSHEVYQSSEFKAFCDRFGIVWDNKTRDLIIVLPFRGAMTVYQEYLGTNEPPDVPEEKYTSLLGVMAGLFGLHNKKE